jgi:hypothetical protein
MQHSAGTDSAPIGIAPLSFVFESLIFYIWLTGYIICNDVTYYEEGVPDW